MDKSSFVTVLTLLVSACAATGGGRQAATPVNRASLYFGQRSLDEDDWEPVEDQLTFGLEYSREHPAHPVGWEVGVFLSEDDDDFRVMGIDAHAEASTTEFYGGVRKTFGGEEARVHPHVGGGLSLIKADLEVNAMGQAVDDDDESVGLYLHGGVSLDLTRVVSLGVDLRLLVGSDVELFGVDADADYEQLALVLGVSF